MSEFEHLFLTLEEADEIIAIDIRDLLKKLTLFIYIRAFLPDDGMDLNRGNLVFYTPELYIDGFVKLERSGIVLPGTTPGFTRFIITKYCNHPELTNQIKILRRRARLTYSKPNKTIELGGSREYQYFCLHSQLTKICESIGIAIITAEKSEVKMGAVETISDGKSGLDTNSDPLAVFRAMEGLEFHEITFNVAPNSKMFRVSAREVKLVDVPYSALGLTHKDQVEPNRQLKVLFDLHRGEFDPNEVGATRSRGHLTTLLNKRFGAKGRPIINNKLIFKMVVPADIRAKESAEIGSKIVGIDKHTPTVGIDGTEASLEENEDGGIEWLKANDTDHGPTDYIP